MLPFLFTLMTSYQSGTRVSLTFGILLLACMAANGQSSYPEPFNTVLYGAAYYPEYMPTDRLEIDVKLMQDAEISVVRVGESTWSSWEPRDGDFQFEWMKRVLDRLHQAGIKVILGTSTYSIPPWLFREHPEIVVSRLGAAPPLTDAYEPSYPSSLTPGYYGPRQNVDLLNPYYRKHSEHIIRQILSHLASHPAVIGFQVDNETGPTDVPTRYQNEAFLAYLKAKYGSPQVLNRIWGLAYWGQLLDTWDDLPPRNGILNPGYKLEWTRFQQKTVTDFLKWQAQIVAEYRRPEQFITTDFSGGVHTDVDQWAISQNLDLVAENPYFATQDRLDGRGIWFTGDLGRSLKHHNYLVTETNAQSIGWDSRTQYPPYPGQLRQVVYAHLAAGANMVEYWHWHSLHYGQETYWRGVLSHDLQPNRTYAEVSRIATELKRLGPQLVNLKTQNKVAILFSADSASAIEDMPFSDTVNYSMVIHQMYNSLYELNIEPDFVSPESDFSAYSVLVIPPLYSASDAVLTRISEFVRAGGNVVMAFKSGFTDEHATVRDVLAPGPLRGAAGFHYQEFTSVPKARKLSPDKYSLGEENSGTVWQEFLVPDTAEVLESVEHPVWHFPAVTRNRFGRGTLTYEATYPSDALQREILRDVLTSAGLTGPDQKLPEVVKVRHGRNGQGSLLHYYFNFSGQPASFDYAYKAGQDILGDAPIAARTTLHLAPWDVAIIAEK